MEGRIGQERIRDLLKFLLRAVLFGLAAAFIVIWLFPELMDQRSGPAAAPRPPDSGAGRVSFHDAVAAVAPAVVNVYATRVHKPRSHPLFQDPLFKRFFGEVEVPEQIDRVFGTGVLLHPDGYVATNVHIIDEAEAIQVTLIDGRQAPARVVGIDPETELAVLRLEDARDLPVAPIGDSASLQVGDIVLAIGNPYDFGQTVTQGIVSATGRRSLGITTFEDFIQTDADINPGNSGGALISTDGLVVGINTANYSVTGSGGSQGIGFAIPVNLVVDVMRQLIEYGHVVRGWLGIEAQVVPRNFVDPAGMRPEGVLVAAVLQGSPAAEAGLMPGDILSEINGAPVADPRQAIQSIAGFKPGTVIELTAVRGWEQMRLNATVGQRPLFRTNRGESNTAPNP